MSINLYVNMFFALHEVVKHNSVHWGINLTSKPKYGNCSS